MLSAFAWLGLVWMSGLLVQKGGAQQAANRLYVVTHVDIIGAGGNLEESLKLLREYATDSQKDPGVVRVEILQQDNRRNHFSVVEVWQSKEAFDAHAAAAHTKLFREKLGPMLGSPYDERLHNSLP